MSLTQCFEKLPHFSAAERAAAQSGGIAYIKAQMDTAIRERNRLREEATLRDNLIVARDGRWQEAGESFASTSIRDENGIQDFLDTNLDTSLDTGLDTKFSLDSDTESLRPGATIDATNDATTVFSALAMFDDAFQQPTPTGKTVEAIAREINKDFAASHLSETEARTQSRGEAKKGWRITAPDGKKAFIYEHRGKVWLDVSRLEPGKSLGNVVYGIAEGYAHNTGKVFIGDPLGLTRTGFYRRLENMISSALRYGTTDHLTPHAAQIDPEGYYDGEEEFKGLGLDWKEGDFAHNLTEMMKVAYNAAVANFPALKDVVYDFDKQQFVNTRDGRTFDREAFGNYVKGLPPGSSPRYRSGGKTAARAVLYNTLVRGESEAEGGSVLAKLMPQLRRGRLDPALKEVFYSIAADAKAAISPERLAATKTRFAQAMDKVIYNLADQYVDLKKVIAAIREAGKVVSDESDAYAMETLMHKKAAERTTMFNETEVQPILDALEKAKVPMADFEKFLHARHAKERNDKMRERNPTQAEIDRQVGELQAELDALRAQGEGDSELQARLDRLKSVQPWTGTLEDRDKLSGMSDDKARDLLAQVQASPHARLFADLGERVDAIVAGTRAEMQAYGLETADVVDALDGAYEHYVPLQRDMEESELLDGVHGSGSGVRGSRIKAATGSLREVEHIFTHLILARENMIQRGEKNRFYQSMLSLVREHPDASFWAEIRPGMSVGQIREVLRQTGATQQQIAEVVGNVTTRIVDPVTGVARTVLNSAWTRMPNVLTLRENGQDRMIVFSRRNDTAVRLALTLRGENGDLVWFPSGPVLSAIGNVTRYLAQMNTQYNPIFGLTNFVRDFQEAALNLASTPLAGKKGEVLKGIPSAMKAIWQTVRGKNPQGPWAGYYREYLESGAATGYRDSFARVEDRARALEREMSGKGLRNMKGVKQVADLLSDYNEMVENATRLAAFVAARNNGLSTQQAAILAKELTVNFNRKGASSGAMSNLYRRETSRLPGARPLPRRRAASFSRYSAWEWATKAPAQSASVVSGLPSSYTMASSFMPRTRSQSVWLAGNGVPVAAFFMSICLSDGNDVFNRAAPRGAWTVKTTTPFHTPRVGRRAVREARHDRYAKDRLSRRIQFPAQRQ